MKSELLKKCEECGRVFDLLDPLDTSEWYAGHDCEDDGMFECEEGHIHDRAGLNGPTHEGAPCPNDPESPNAYPEDDDD